MLLSAYQCCRTKPGSKSDEGFSMCMTIVRDTVIQTTCGVYLRIGSTAQRNSKVPTVVPASKGVKLKYVLGERIVMSKSSASEEIWGEYYKFGLPHRFLSIFRRTLYPPQPDPRITTRCLRLTDETLNRRAPEKLAEYLKIKALRCVVIVLNMYGKRVKAMSK